MHQKVNILGVQISSITNDDLLAAFTQHILNKEKKQVCLPQEFTEKKLQDVGVFMKLIGA